MAVWATAIFQRDEHPADPYGGTFTAAGGNGLLPTAPPFYAIYNITTMSGGGGGETLVVGGSITVY